MIRGFIKDRLMLPYLDINLKYQDLGIRYRDHTGDQVTARAAQAQHGAGSASIALIIGLARWWPKKTTQVVLGGSSECRVRARRARRSMSRWAASRPMSSRDLAGSNR